MKEIEYGNIPRDAFSGYRKPLLSGLLIGLAVVVATLLLGDLKGAVGIWQAFDLRYLPFIFLLAPLNYVFRYIKWNYYLKLAGLYPDAKMNRLIFLSGLSMAVTPGKIGELLKCYLLKEHMGAPVSVTSSIVMAERLSDGISMVILASFGVLVYAHGFYALLAIFFFLAALVFVFHFDAFFGYLERLLKKCPFWRGFMQKSAEFLREFQGNARRLFSLPSLLFAVGIGVISWGFEGLVIFLAVKAFGGEISILGSIFVVSFSSLLGALSLLPGGLGVAEGSIMALLLLIGLGREMAAATTLVTRFSTLWLGVAIGLAGFYLLQRKFFRKENTDES
ncbi:MAG: flippase-like domain-containing protein [Firmicutes bacterium]|nr:flippase-like domain-containing protein [Bacillota bacterium]